MDLAHGVARQVLHEHDALGQFEFGQAIIERRQNLFLRELGTGLPDHDGGDALAEIRVRAADHRGFDDAGQGVDFGFDLLRIDVEAAGDDEILGAPDNVNIALRVDLADIAGDEKPVRAKLGLGLLRHTPIAAEHVRTLDLDDADVSVRQDPPGLRVGDAQADARQRKADGAGNASAIVGIGCIHAGFGHTIAFENGMARLFLKFTMGFRQQRRRPGNEQAHMLRRLTRQFRVSHKPGIERRHAHHRGGARQQRHDLVGVEFWQEDHRPARQHHRVRGDEQAVGVVDRQRMQQHVAVAEAPVVDQRQRIGGQVAVAEHRALRPAGGAGSVKDRGKIIRFAGHIGKIGGRGARRVHQRTAATGIERLDRGDTMS